jgi:hypothetical protein
MNMRHELIGNKFSVISIPGFLSVTVTAHIEKIHITRSLHFQSMQLLSGGISHYFLGCFTEKIDRHANLI